MKFLAVSECDADGAVDSETSAAEEKYNQLPSLETLPEAYRTTQTEMID